MSLEIWILSVAASMACGILMGRYWDYFTSEE